MQPGETITPNQKTQKSSSVSETMPDPGIEPTEKTELPAPEAAFQFNPEGVSATSSSTDTGGSQETVEWTASEFIAHHKQLSWFTGLGLATLLVTAVVYFITRDMISTFMVPVAGGLFGFIASRQPKSRKYAIDFSGVIIGQQRYGFSVFKSFSVEQEGAVRSVRLLPLKRFMPAIFMYYAPEDESKIIQYLAKELPFEKHEPDLVDKFMKRVRF